MFFRRRRSEVIRRSFEPAGFKDVVFVFDEPGAGARYRCEHQAEQLNFLGTSAEVVESSQIDLTAAVDHYGCFVLNRVAWRKDLTAFLDHARSKDKAVVYDTDDLIFEPDLDRHFAFLDSWPEKNRKAQIERFELQLRTLEACGRATVSTEPLAESAGRRVSEVGVVFNSVSEEMVRLADQALVDSPNAADAVTIAYLSGTRTHDKDFLEAADAVLWALEEYPDARFLAVGKLELDRRFQRFGAQVSRIPIQPWRALPSILAEVDVNLAPLEGDNPVTECKSCVKYLEAGLLGVPTVASARTDFVRVIENGTNGLLADTPDQWREALGILIESPSLAREVGARALEDIRENHTTKARAHEVLARMA
jgi:O-antigen biosynthesis protein